MTKENYEKFDKTKDIYCECCKQNKPTSSYNYRNIITNHYSIPILYLWETDINQNPNLCIALIKYYIENDCNLPNYHSFNWKVENNNLSQKKELIVPYQDIPVNKYRHLIKKKVG